MERIPWKHLATLLEGDYDGILQKIRHSAVLHADETGWRLNGVTCWLWAFATAQYCYYLIDPHRGTAVVTRVLGTLFPGILITDFWGGLQRDRDPRQTEMLFSPVHRIDQSRQTHHRSPVATLSQKVGPPAQGRGAPGRGAAHPRSAALRTTQGDIASAPRSTHRPPVG